MQEQKCEHDENGHCKTHGPGTAGEVETVNKIIVAVQEQIGQAMLPLLDLAGLVKLAESAIRQKNAASPDGKQLRNVEAEILEVMKTLLFAGRDAIEKLDALRMISPNAS